MNSSDIFGQGVKVIAAGASVMVEPRVRDNLMRQFVISNLNLSTATPAVLYICDTEGNEAIPVFPQFSATIETDSPFRLAHSQAAGGSLNAATSIAYVVGQVMSNQTHRAGRPNQDAIGGDGGGIPPAAGSVATRPSDGVGFRSSGGGGFLKRLIP